MAQSHFRNGFLLRPSLRGIDQAWGKATNSLHNRLSRGTRTASEGNTYPLAYLYEKSAHARGVSRVFKLKEEPTRAYLSCFLLRLQGEASEKTYAAQHANVPLSPSARLSIRCL